MSAFTAWIMSILGIVVVGTIVDLILPVGRMNKYVKSVFASVTVVIIVLPIPGLIKNGFKFDGDYIFDSNFVLDENFLEYSKDFKLNYIEKGLDKVFSDAGIHGAGIEIEGEVSGTDIKITQVKINLSNVVIDEKIQHINKYELIDKLVTENLKVDKEVVSVYE